MNARVFLLAALAALCVAPTAAADPAAMGRTAGFAACVARRSARQGARLFIPDRCARSAEPAASSACPQPATSAISRSGASSSAL